MICIPKNIMVNVIRDLKDGDYAKEEVNLLNYQLDLHNQYIVQSDSTNAKLRDQVIFLSGLVDDKDQQINIMVSNMNAASRHINRQKTWIKCVGAGLVVSLVTSFIKK